MYRLVLLLALCGCTAPSVGGYSGRDLILVQVVGELAETRTTDGASFLEAARLGTHFWDPVGAQLRVADELQDLRTPQVLQVCFGTAGDGGLDASYLVGGGVTVDWDAWTRNPSSLPVAAELLAHEFGHAMGLEHLPEETALMHARMVVRFDLSEADVREFRRIWP